MKVAKLSTLALAAFTPKEDPWYSTLLEVEMILGPQCCQEDKSIKKKPKALQWIKPTTFLLVMKCLNQLQYGVPIICDMFWLVPGHHQQNQLYAARQICIIYVNNVALHKLLWFRFTTDSVYGRQQFSSVRLWRFITVLHFYTVNMKNFTINPLTPNMIHL